MDAKGSIEALSSPPVKTFNWLQIRKALTLIVEKKKGVRKSLLEEFKRKNIANNENEASELFETLELLGYLSRGISKEHKQITWKATKRAYREILPWWLLLFKRLMGKI